MSSEVPLAEGLTREFLLHSRLCPRELAPDGTLLVAAADGALLDALDELAFAYARPVVAEPAPLAEVERMIERLSNRAERMIELAQVHGDDDLATDVRDLANQPPVIRYVNSASRSTSVRKPPQAPVRSNSSRSLSCRWRLCPNRPYNYEKQNHA